MQSNRLAVIDVHEQENATAFSTESLLSFLFQITFCWLVWEKWERGSSNRWQADRNAEEIEGRKSIGKKQNSMFQSPGGDATLWLNRIFSVSALCLFIFLVVLCILFALRQFSWALCTPIMKVCCVCVLCTNAERVITQKTWLPSMNMRAASP